MALVLLPSILALASAEALYQLLAESEQIARANAIHEHLSRIEQCVLEAARSVGQMALENDVDKSYQRYQRTVAEFPMQIQALRAVIAPGYGRPATKAEAQALAAVDRLDAVSQRVKATADEGVEHLHHGQSGNLIFIQLKPIVKEFKNETEDIQVAADEVTGHADPSRTVELQKKMVLTVQGMVAGFVLLAILSTIYAVRGITFRLRALMINTHLLAAGKPLQPAIGGTDEIAELDDVFHRMAKALEAAAEKERNVMRAKQEFMQMISHDLRTPLTSIQLFLNLLNQGVYGDLSAKAAQKAQIADNNAQRLIKLVTDLLEIEKVESGQLQLDPIDCDAGKLVSRALNAVSAFAEQQSILLESTITEQVAVFADGERIVQVLVNLVGNAIKFSPPGGKVLLSAVAVTGTRTARISVKDQGRGIPSNLKEQIFQRFKQLETGDATSKKGTGLGLSICKAIVEQSGGEIGVESEEGNGSTFWFTLPLSQSDLAVESITAANISISSPKGIADQR